MDSTKLGRFLWSGLRGIAQIGHGTSDWLSAPTSCKVRKIAAIEGEGPMPCACH